MVLVGRESLADGAGVERLAVPVQLGTGTIPGLLAHVERDFGPAGVYAGGSPPALTLTITPALAAGTVQVAWAGAVLPFQAVD